MEILWLVAKEIYEIFFVHKVDIVTEEKKNFIKRFFDFVPFWHC